jgi:hypothetical protein
VIVVDHANDGTGSKDDDQEQWQSLTVNWEGANYSWGG